VGSRTLSRRLPMSLSPATIRNVMADLTDAGLLFARTPRRPPAHRAGPALFVDGLLQFGELGDDDREAITTSLAASGRSLEDTLAEASTMLSACPPPPARPGPEIRRRAAPHRVRPARLRPRPVVLVNADGQVENRVIDIPPGVPPSALQQAGNYLNARLAGRPLVELRTWSPPRLPPTAPSWTPCPHRWWKRAWPPGPARAAAAA